MAWDFGHRRSDDLDFFTRVPQQLDTARMFSALQRMHPAEVDAEAGRHIARALTEFGDAELDPDPIVRDETKWPACKQTAEQLAAALLKHLRH